MRQLPFSEDMGLVTELCSKYEKKETILLTAREPRRFPKAEVLLRRC
jgi:hypothetical protein